MCTYNGARWIEQQLTSILQQTHKPCEVVICDDRSTDDTAAVVERLAAASPIPIRFSVNPQNLGISLNFQRAMSLCTGDYIALSDQDDWWHPRKLEILAGALDAAPEAAYSFCDARLVDQHLRPMGFLLWDIHQLTPERQQILQSERSMELMTVANFATGATMLFRRSWLEHILPVSTNWIHDGWLSLMLSAFSTCVLVDEALVDYRQHPSQKVGACRREQLKELKWQIKMDKSFFARAAPRWADAYEVLSSRRHLMRRPEDIELVRRRAVLDRDRLSLRVDPGERWDAVYRHLSAGDYDRYAWGKISAAVDLIWPA
jgi:glycosyltransferase involved in cell wall biosynthesis